MSESLFSADCSTHLRIVAVALVAAIVVVMVGTYARVTGSGTTTAGVQVDRPVLKAAQPTALTDSVHSSVR